MRTIQPTLAVISYSSQRCSSLYFALFGTRFLTSTAGTPFKPFSWQDPISGTSGWLRRQAPQSRKSLQCTSCPDRECTFPPCQAFEWGRLCLSSHRLFEAPPHVLCSCRDASWHHRSLWEDSHDEIRSWQDSDCGDGIIAALWASFPHYAASSMRQKAYSEDHIRLEPNVGIFWRSSRCQRPWASEGLWETEGWWRQSSQWCALSHRLWYHPTPLPPLNPGSRCSHKARNIRQPQIRGWSCLPSSQAWSQ